MEETIQNFPKQFEFEAAIVNKDNLVCGERFVLCGMGGSHLAGGLLKMRRPNLQMFIHRDYGLPEIAKSDLKKTLFIASSYSGNTEEVLDFAAKAFEQKLNLAVIAVGGELIQFADKNKIPYIKLPDTGIQPRSALGYSITALAKIIDDESVLSELSKLRGTLKSASFEKQGKELAEQLKGKVPIIYSSARNGSIAYNWKIKCNETGKIPAFRNVFSELNHNEMAGFDVIDSTHELSKNFYFIFLTDTNDHPQIQKRMKVCGKLYKDRGLLVTEVKLSGTSVFDKIFSSLLIADWMALHISKIYGTEPERVPIIEEFKKLIS